jgi:hypothetical protein
VNQGTINNTGGSSEIYGNYSAGLNFVNSGTITASGGTLTLGEGQYDTVTNSGLISASTGGTIDLGYYYSANTWSNTGTLTVAGGGTINLAGTFTTAALGGVIDAAGGTINISGNLINTGSTLSAPTTGTYTLYEGTITGGTVASGAIAFGYDGTLNGVTLVGNFTNATSSYAYLNVNSGTIFTGGTTTLNPSSFTDFALGGTGTALTIASSATFIGSEFYIYNSGSNPITFVNNGTINNTGNYSDIYGSYYGGGLTFVNNGTVIGSGGTLQLGDETGDTVTNAGLISATSGGTINIGGYYTATSWTNTGTISAAGGGTIDLDGTFTTASLGGTIDAAGGTINLEGILNNAGTTLNPPTTGVYTLNQGTINGGTVASGALTLGYNGTLNGVTMNGNFSNPVFTYFNVSNNTTFTGGTTTFTTNGSNYVDLGGTGTALTIASDATWTGGINIYNQASNPVIVAIQGVLDETGSYSTIEDYYGYGITVNNSGTIESSGGGELTLGYYSGDTFTNMPGGTLEADNSSIYLDSYQSNVTNLAANTLTGGKWMASNGGELNFNSGTDTINTIGVGTTVVLDGVNSNIYSGNNQTLESTLTTNNGILAVISDRDYSTTNALTNNGGIALGGGTLAAASLTNNPGSEILGFGNFDPTGGVTIGSGVMVSPGAPIAGYYVEALGFNSLTFGPGGAYTFDIMNASGVAGTDYDTINVSGGLTITATPAAPFTIDIESIDPVAGVPGMANFNYLQAYQWTLLASSGISGFSATDFMLDTTAFQNGFAGGNFSLTSDGSNIFLNFTPVPEPSTWALIASGLGIVGIAARRRRARAAAAR